MFVAWDRPDDVRGDWRGSGERTEFHRVAGDVHVQTTRHLLELPLKDDEKQVAESVLENALLLQATLQETERLDDGASEPESGPGPV